MSFPGRAVVPPPGQRESVGRRNQREPVGRQSPQIEAIHLRFRVVSDSQDCRISQIIILRLKTEEATQQLFNTIHQFEDLRGLVVSHLHLRNRTLELQVRPPKDVNEVFNALKKLFPHEARTINDLLLQSHGGM